jgi:H+/Cl- antiporter ClcA
MTWDMTPDTWGLIVRALRVGGNVVVIFSAFVFAGLVQAQTEVAGAPAQSTAGSTVPAALDPNIVALLAFVAALVGALVGAAIVRKIRHGGRDQGQQKSA